MDPEGLGNSAGLPSEAEAGELCEAAQHGQLLSGQLSPLQGQALQLQQRRQKLTATARPQSKPCAQKRPLLMGPYPLQLTQIPDL